MPRARAAAERARRVGGAGLRWAVRLLLVVGVVIGAGAGFVVGVLAWLLGADAVAVLAGPLIGGGLAFLAVRLGLAHGHRLAPLALWIAERRVAGSGTAAILVMVARLVLGRGGTSARSRRPG